MSRQTEYLEHPGKDGGPAKFYEVVRDGARVTIRYGKVGKAGRVTTAEYPTPAQRPAWSCLDTTRLREDFGLALPDWREAVKQVIAQIRHP